MFAARARRAARLARAFFMQFPVFLLLNRPPFTSATAIFLYFIQRNVKENPAFIEENLNDICASIQYTIVEILFDKIKKAVKQTGITHVAIAGGVSANSEIRKTLKASEEKYGWTTYIPKFQYTTDNAAMIAYRGSKLFENNIESDLTAHAYPSLPKNIFKNLYVGTQYKKSNERRIRTTRKT